ncbi:hypothetical protein [Flavobacterium sp. 245]|uniref:hypothetical protein n=1 Tax=Flavobacterium sp. 245 TaxID=2512115 RepID=UPI00106102A8|nr:hypothetical protein [Flavobacterium sp. 245]TDO96606.1 hypothetical protein EV145_111106 [Flavobacterium sp. 245]
MEVLSFIISIVGIIIHIVQKADNSSYSSNRSSYGSTTTHEVVHKFTPEEKLENMNIDSLNICLKTGEAFNFSLEKARLTLLNKYVQSDFYIDDALIRKNCMYIKVRHSIPFKGSNKCYGASFSINYMTVNNGISVYGSQKLNADEKQVFEEIANELIKAIS